MSVEIVKNNIQIYIIWSLNTLNIIQLPKFVIGKRLIKMSVLLKINYKQLQSYTYTLFCIYIIHIRQNISHKLIR